MTGEVAVGGAVLVTGVSRRAGIGFAVARRLLARGDRVVVHSWAPHDSEQPWGGDDLGAVWPNWGSRRASRLTSPLRTPSASSSPEPATPWGH